MRLICGDCLDVLKTLPDGCVDAVVTDPPYGTNYSSGSSPNCSWYDRPIKGDESTYCRDAVIEWAERRGLPWACFGSWKVRPPRGTRAALVWDKGPAFGMGDLSLPWKPSWELIFIGGKGWRGERGEGVLRGDCVVSWESRGRVHPNQKPDWLLRAILKKLPPGGTVLDPFMGSGTTGVACVREGRGFIGVEQDADYFAVAQRRIAEAEGCRDGKGVGELFAGAP